MWVLLNAEFKGLTLRYAIEHAKPCMVIVEHGSLFGNLHAALANVVIHAKVVVGGSLLVLPQHMSLFLQSQGLHPVAKFQ